MEIEDEQQVKYFQRISPMHMTEIKSIEHLRKKNHQRKYKNRIEKVDTKYDVSHYT